jgi:hypothetical protein
MTSVLGCEDRRQPKQAIGQIIRVEQFRAIDQPVVAQPVAIVEMRIQQFPAGIGRRRDR